MPEAKLVIVGVVAPELHKYVEVGVVVLVTLAVAESPTQSVAAERFAPRKQVVPFTTKQISMPQFVSVPVSFASVSVISIVQFPCGFSPTKAASGLVGRYANAVDKLLFQRGVHTFLLDGDNIRHGLCAGPNLLSDEHGAEFAHTLTAR